MHLTSANKHVPEIEHEIRVIKEREICIRHSLPFNRIPRLFLIHKVFVSVKMLKTFPNKRRTIKCVQTQDNLVW